MKVIRLKLSHRPGLRSAPVKWLLHETVGENFDIEEAETCEIPVLQITLDSGHTINMTESGAMISLLADTYVDARLAPAAYELTPARADYLQMLHFGSTSMDMALWQIYMHEFVFSAGRRDVDTILCYRRKLATEIEPHLLARLQQDDFICGSAFSAADCVVGYNVAWAMAMGFCEDQAFAGYARRLAQRPAYVSAFSDARYFAFGGPKTQL